MSAPYPRLTLTAGQIGGLSIAFKDAAGAAIDLTGSTVALVAKSKLTDEDADALIDTSQAEHEDAEAGITSLPIDLSDLDEVWFEEGGLLIGSLWLIDADENRIPYGNLTIKIDPSAKYKPAAE